MRRLLLRYLVVMLSSVVLLLIYVRFVSKDVPTVRPRASGVVYWHGNTSVPNIALTFDDGPNEPYTSQILDVLKEARVHATFFMVGRNVERYPDAARRIVREGHAIGNHSYAHPDMVLETDGAVRQQILKAEQVIEATTGRRSELFRAPYGFEDPLTLLVSERLGYKIIKWSVSGQDWERPGSSVIVNRVISRTHNGAIILLHDGDKLRHGSDRSQTVSAVSQIIEQLTNRGYRFVSVDELLKTTEAEAAINEASGGKGGS